MSLIWFGIGAVCGGLIAAASVAMLWNTSTREESERKAALRIELAETDAVLEQRAGDAERFRERFREPCQYEGCCLDKGHEGPHLSPVMYRALHGIDEP